MPENEDVWELWQASATQWRSGGMGMVGLDYTAVALVAEKLDLTFCGMTLKRIAALEREVLSSQGNKGASDVPEYCLACSTAGNNTDCSTCDLTKVQKQKGHDEKAED